MVSFVNEPNTYHMVMRGRPLYAVVPADVLQVASGPQLRFVTNSKGYLRIPEWIADASRFAVIGQSFTEGAGRPSAFQVRFQVKDWSNRTIWFEREQLRAFFTRQLGNFLWACTVDSGWSRGMLISLFNQLDDNIRLDHYYKSNLLNPTQAQQVEEAVNKHIRWWEGKTAMDEREQKKQRGECAGCPGAMMCWGGENLLGHDCVICGRMFLGRSVSGESESGFELLGEIKMSCTEVAWRKDVCDDCKPDYRETVNETLYALLQEYETKAS